MILRSVVYLLLIFHSGVVASTTLGATMTKLKQIAQITAPRPVGRQDGGTVPLRTSFFKALGDVERSIKLAEVTVNPKKLLSSSARKSLLQLRKVIVSAARKGNYRIGREIFGYARYIEDGSSLSRSRKRFRRDSEDFINYIKDKIGDQTFNQFFNIESGTSLTFVLDTTGSMVEDIHQVQNIVRELSTPEEDDMGSGFYNFLLAPFKDPDYGPVESYIDKAEFLSALEALTVNGGGDCDELVLKGMIEGLEETEAYSPVFVFTDAGTKDKDEYDNVLSLAQNLLSPLFFFITPSEECPKNISTYEELASETSGQVISITKEEIGDMNGMVKAVGIGSSTLTSGTEGQVSSRTRDKRSTGEVHDITFECDNTVTKLLVTVNFQTPTGASYLVTPDRNMVYPTFVSALTNMRLYEILDPRPGTWSLKAITDIGDRFTYKVNSVSPTNIDFDFYLLKEYRGREIPTDNAIPGEVMKLKLNILGEDGAVKANRSELYLMDTAGNVISTVQTFTLSEEFSYQYDGVFIVPTETFKFMLYGETREGHPFTRTSQGTITPSYGVIQSSNSVTSKRMIRPGSRGNFYFKFEHYSDTTNNFIITFTNPGNILTSSSPIQLNDIRKERSKLIRLPYSISRSVPEGSEYRITLVASGGDIRVSYVYPVLVTRFAV